MEAILWHGGEGAASRDAVLAMNATEREALIEYVKFPFVDPATISSANTCAPDMNADGVLDFFDVSAFIGAFQSGAPDGDFNGDSVYNFFDISAFISAYTQGCP